MKGFKEKYGPWAIIAGSAEGLGEAWSRTLAAQGLNLIMVDNQEDKLEKLARVLEKEFNIETSTISTDLSEETAANEILNQSKEFECRLLVYNAAYSRVKPFLDNTTEDIRYYIGINTYTQLKLVNAFSVKLAEDGKGGGIILMSSLAGLIGMQLVASYASTKAFAWNLAEALYHELQPHNIDVLACIAGATSTPAYEATDPKYGRIKPQVMAPAAVSEEAIRKLGKKARHVCGFKNRLNYFILTRLLPRKLATGMANKVMKKMYDHE
jgi:short-subunit dehydrogenase